MYLSLAVHAVVFSIFYTLLFIFLFKTKALKPTFTAVFIFTAALYFVLTILLGKYLAF